MSYMALYGVWPGEKAESIKEYSNSWGGLTVVWKALAGKYLGITKSYSHPDKGVDATGRRYSFAAMVYVERPCHSRRNQAGIHVGV